MRTRSSRARQRPIRANGNKPRSGAKPVDCQHLSNPLNAFLNRSWWLTPTRQVWGLAAHCGPPLYDGRVAQKAASGHVPAACTAPPKGVTGGLPRLCGGLSQNDEPSGPEGPGRLVVERIGRPDVAGSRISRDARAFASRTGREVASGGEAASASEGRIRSRLHHRSRGVTQGRPTARS